jgi:hypothetical protein
MAVAAHKPLPKPKRRGAVRPPAAGGGAAPAAGPAPKVSGAAARDPRFTRVMAQLQKSAATARRHEPAARKAAQAQAAAVSPPQERVAGAQAGQVEVMKEADAKPPEKGGFLALLRQQIQAIMPKDLNSADSFMKGGEKEQVKGAVSGGVKDQKEEAAGPTQQAAAAAPDTSAVEPREATPMPADPAAAPPPVAGAEAMPAPRPAEDLGAFDRSTKDADRQLSDNKLTEGQLSEANDPRFSKVVTARGALQKEAAAAPGQYRAAEAATLKAASKDADAAAAAGVRGMVGARGASAAGVKTRQQLAKERDEARRKEVAGHVQAIYDRTKQKVEAKLDALEPEVLGLFDRGADAALERMKSSANREIDDFKDERYSGLRGKARWLADKFRDVPDEIKAILRKARERFMAEMDALAVQIAGVVDRRVDEAKAEIARGEAEIKAYVAGLPKDLQAVGKAAAQQIAARFDELRSAVDQRQEALAQKLAQKYKEASDKAGEALKKLEEENKGFLKGLVDAVAEVLQAIKEFKDRMVAVFKKGADTIWLIVKAPIRFLGHLLDAAKQGFGQFVDHIWEHLKAGFMQWLFGSLADAGIELPKDFSLGSVLKLVLQVLGITYDRMRAKAVKLVGERAVAILEKVFGFLYTLVTAGPAKLWEEMKEYLSDLKAQVIDALQSWVVTTIVKAAITKLVTMFNPVGAIVQAILTIYNFVMFIVEQAKKILALIEAIVNSVAEIASGAISRAATWIEQALARLVPVAIGLLARLIGLSGVTDKIKEIIKKVQATVDRAVDKVIEKVVAVVKKLVGAAKSAAKGLVAWWTRRKSFQSPDGHDHEIFFEGAGPDAKLVVASRQPAKGAAALLEELRSKDPAKAAAGLQAVQALRAATAKLPEDPKQLDVVDAKLEELKKIFQALGVPGSADLPVTKVVPSASSGRAKKVVADPLTKLPGNTKGSTASANPLGWELAQAANEIGGSIWVRAHLLAYILHGPGNEIWNLTPADKSANGAMSAQAEIKASDDAKKGLVVRYETDIDYAYKGAIEDQFASAIHVKYVATDPGTRKQVDQGASDPKSQRPSERLKGTSIRDRALQPIIVMYLAGVSRPSAEALVREGRKSPKLTRTNLDDRLAAVPAKERKKIRDAIESGALSD